MSLKKKPFLIIGVMFFILAMSMNAYATPASSLSLSASGPFNVNDTFDVQVNITGTGNFTGLDTTITFPVANFQVTAVTINPAVTSGSVTYSNNLASPNITNANDSTHADAGKLKFAGSTSDIAGLAPISPLVTVTFKCTAAGTNLQIGGSYSVTDTNFDSFSTPAYSVSPVTIGGATNYTVNFAASPAAGGTVTPAAAQTVASGAQTTAVTAAANATYTFVNWKDELGNVVSTALTLPAQTITAAKTYTAYFTTSGGPYTVSFAASPAAGGTVTPSAAQTVASGTSTAEVTATANSCYTFTNWTGTGGFTTTTANPLTVSNVTANMTITANFTAAGSNTLTFASSDTAKGTVTGTTPQTVNCGASASAVTAAAKTGYQFNGWTGPNGFTSASATLTLTNVTATMAGAYTANFGIAPPTASNTVLVTTAGVAKSSTLSATGGTAPYTFSIVTDLKNSSGIVTVNSNGSYGYSPNANFSGTDSFTFAVTDSLGEPSDPTKPATATVTITVLPAANAGTLTTVKNTVKAGTLTALGTAPFKFNIVTPPMTGATLTGTPAFPDNTTGTFTYTPKLDYIGADSFTFSVTDAKGLSSTATIAITVYASNTAPMPNNLTLMTRPEQAVNGVLSATDAEGNSLTYTIVTPPDPAKGTLVQQSAGSPNFTYTPLTGFGATTADTDTFTFKVNDGTVDSAADGTVTINVTPFSTATNHLPVANSQVYPEAGKPLITVGTVFSGKLHGTDEDGDLLSYILWTAGTSDPLLIDAKCGDVQLSDGNSPDAGVDASFTYLPRLDKPGCNNLVTGAAGGTDSFTYRVSERANSPDFPQSASVGTITLTINKVCTPTTATAAITATDGTTTVNSGGTITLATPPKSVTFTDTTTDTASRVWTIVDSTGATVPGGTSTVTPFTYSFATVGTYTVNLVAADAAGCATPQAATVTVNVTGTPTCTVAITTSPAATGGIVMVPTASLPAPVTFTGSTAGTWSMTGPSGVITLSASDTTSNPLNYTFAAGSDGTYTVKLTATPAGCTTASTATVTVYVGMRITSVQVNPSNSAQLLINGSGFSTTANCSEVWYNTANSTTTPTPIKLSPITVNAAGTQITFTKPSAGTYYFFVKNTCATPAAWSNSYPFSVPSDYVPENPNPNPTVTADFNVNGKTDQVTGCAPLEVQFTNASTAGYLTCSWWFGDGNDTTKDPDSMECNPKHSYAKAGLYSVTLQIFGFNGSGTKTLKDFVKVDSCCVTTASFTTNPATGTAPLAVSFDASASIGDKFSWDFGDTQTGTGKTATHTYAAAGTYTVKLTVTDASDKCVQTSTASVTVAAAVNCDVVAASFSANPMSGDKPLVVNFDASASQNAATYSWDYGDAQTGSGVTPNHTYTAAGTYAVTLTVKDTTGKCSKTATQTIKVAQGACTTTASFTADPMTGEAPLNVLFNAAGSSADVKSYSWDYGDGQTDTGVSPAKHSFTKAGSYTVTLMVTGDCTASAKKTIEVKATDRPSKPVLVTPANGSTRVSLTPTLTVQSNYSSSVNAPHAKTRWQIALDKDFNNLVYDVTNGQNLTSIWVPDFILKPNTVYYWRVQFIDNRNVASDWSEIFTFTTIETNAEDTNNSGVPDTQEAAGADANSLCAKSPKSGVVVCVKASNGVKPAGLKWISASTLAAGPSGITFPSDMFTFRELTAKSGDVVTMTYTFSEPLPAEAVWYKYNQIDGWKQYTLNISADRKTVTQVLTEGMSGDSDGTANSIIVDPVGFGVGATASAACLDCGDDGGGGCFISAVSGGTAGSTGMAILTLFSMAGIYLSRRGK